VKRLPDEAAREGLQKYFQNLYAQLGIDLTDGDPRSGAERLAATLFPDRSPRDAVLAFQYVLDPTQRKLRDEAAWIARKHWALHDRVIRRAVAALADELGESPGVVKSVLVLDALTAIEYDAFDPPAEPKTLLRWIERDYTRWRIKFAIALAEARLRHDTKPALFPRPDGTEAPDVVAVVEAASVTAALPAAEADPLESLIERDEQATRDRALAVLRQELSPRLREYVALVHLDLTDPEIAQRMGVTESTVRGYRRAVLHKVAPPPR